MPKVLRLRLPAERPNSDPEWLAAVIEDLGARFRRSGDSIIQEADGSILLTVHEVENLSGIKGFLSQMGISYEMANDLVVVSLESALIEAPSVLRDYVEQLQAALEMTATSFARALAGLSVANAPHCFAAAESLTEGTEHEFRR